MECPVRLPVRPVCGPTHRRLSGARESQMRPRSRAGPGARSLLLTNGRRPHVRLDDRPGPDALASPARAGYLPGMSDVTDRIGVGGRESLKTTPDPFLLARRDRTA